MLISYIFTVSKILLHCSNKEEKIEYYYTNPFKPFNSIKQIILNNKYLLQSIYLLGL